MEVYRILFIVTVGDYLVPWPTRREPSAIYRPQAEFSGGRFDGKSGVRSGEIS
jgi:hypothetical protein